MPKGEEAREASQLNFIPSILNKPVFFILTSTLKDENDSKKAA